MYLQKSRADMEEKHKKDLLNLAKQQGLNIIKIREEVVSGNH
jgi:site-specific DNA recombinase